MSKATFIGCCLLFLHDAPLATIKIATASLITAIQFSAAFQAEATLLSAYKTKHTIGTWLLS